jgi:hypothetical protein
MNPLRISTHAPNKKPAQASLSPVTPKVCPACEELVVNLDGHLCKTEPEPEPKPIEKLRIATVNSEPEWEIWLSAETTVNARIRLSAKTAEDARKQADELAHESRRASGVIEWRYEGSGDLMPDDPEIWAVDRVRDANDAVNDLKKLLEPNPEPPTIYCIIRDKNNFPADSRHNRLHSKDKTWKKGIEYKGEQLTVQFFLNPGENPKQLSTLLGEAFGRKIIRATKWEGVLLLPNQSVDDFLTQVFFLLFSTLKQVKCVVL